MATMKSGMYRIYSQIQNLNESFYSYLCLGCPRCVYQKCFPTGLCGEIVFQAWAHQPHASGIDGFLSWLCHFPLYKARSDLTLVIIKGEGLLVRAHLY